MKTKRVGTITMGIVLIALGVIMFISQINGRSALNLAIKLWPLILILLGLEILYFRYISKDEGLIIRYDILSIFLVMVILFTNLGLYALTEVGLISRFQRMVMSEHFTYPMNINEFNVDSTVEKIVIYGQNRGALTIRAGEDNRISGTVTVDVNASSQEEAKRLLDTEYINYRRVGNTVYISVLKTINGRFEGYHIQPYDLTLNLPKNIDLEVKDSNNLDIIFDDFENNLVLDGIYNLKIRLSANGNAKVNTYVTSEDKLMGSIKWNISNSNNNDQLITKGEYIQGTGENLIKIINCGNVAVDEI